MRLRAWSGVLLMAGLFQGSGINPVRADLLAWNPIIEVAAHGARYRVCPVDLSRRDLRLFWGDAAGNPLGNFSALEKLEQADHQILRFAANAGMFDPVYKPVGLLVLNGEQKSPLNMNDGYGNFYMKPNGVFAINGKHHAFIVESGVYQGLVPPILWATQSGPLLVHGGDVNPDFMPDSKNRKIRSGVGVTKTGEVVFALSEEPVTFYAFAELFREKLHCPNALYLDGEISAFWEYGDVEKAGQHHFGPIFGVVEPDVP